MKKLRIQYLLSTADLVGGTEQAIIHQANALARRGHHVEVVSVYRDRHRPHFRVHERVRITYAIDRRGQRIRTHRAAPIKPAEAAVLMEEPSYLVPPAWDVQFNALCDRTLPALLLRSKADVVVAPTPPLAAYAAHYCRDSVIVQQEHRPTAFRVGSVFGRINTYAGRVDALVSLTDRSTEWIGAHLTGRAPRLETIPNMNPDGFYPQSSCSAPVIVAAGRLSGQKRFDHLVEAFALVSDEFPDWTLRIFGEGSTRRPTQSAIENGELWDRAFILPYVKDLRLEMAKASIVGMTSVFEGLPLVGLEAIATGVPFVSYDIPTGPAEIIADGVNGFLAPDGDVVAFAEKLRILMADRDLRRRMGEQARASAARYSEATIAEKWETLFGELLSGKPARPAPEQTTTAPAVVEQQPSAVKLQPAISAQRTTRAVLERLASRSVEWAPIPGYSATSVIAIRETDLQRFGEALADLPELVAQCTVPGSRGSRWASGARSIATLLPLIRPSVVGLVTETSVEVAQRSDPAALLEVEVWRATPDGTFVRPRHNRAFSEIKSSCFTRRPPDIAPQETEELRSLWCTVDFPIDVVYMWVDGNDPQWQRRRGMFLNGGQADYHPESVDSTRFVDREELRYSLRSLDAYAPWVNRIFVVTDQQRPHWLKTLDGKLEIVDHRDIFPDPSVLPTFNSHAIEASLHNIPGLAEHFIVMNDDVMINRSVPPTQFFSSAGQASLFMSPVKIDDLDDPPPHISAARNNREIIERLCGGKRITQCLLHTPHPQRRSVLQSLEREIGDRIRATRSSRFRAEGDVSLCSSLAQYYGYFSGSYLVGSIKYSYLRLNDAVTARQMRDIEGNHGLDVFAIGENSGGAEFEDTNEILRDFFDRLFPWPSPYELDASPASVVSEAAAGRF